MQRFYFDTSVFGGIYDEEFRDDTIALFEMVRNGQIICVYSELTQTELSKAPSKVKEHFLSLPKDFLEEIPVTEEAYNLADEYIKEKVVGKPALKIADTLLLPL